MKRRFIVVTILTLIVFIAIEAFRSGALGGASGGSAASHWSWNGGLGDDGWVNIRNTVGPITVLESSNGQVSVQAQNSWKGGNAGPVEFVVNRDGGSLFICAMNSNDPRQSDCDENSYSPGQRSWWKRVLMHQRTPHVAFTLRVPNSASLNLRTVNGDVTVKGPAEALVAKTVNGSISTAYPVRSMNAETVNGKIRAKLSGIDSSATMKLETVNGAVSAEIPADANLSLRARTVHGEIRSEFPVTTSAQPASRSMSGVIGSGGAVLEMVAVNGSITLEKLVEAEGTASASGGGASASATRDSASAAPRDRE